MSQKSKVLSINGRLFVLEKVDRWTDLVRLMNSTKIVGKVRRDRRNQRRIWSETWDGIDLFEHTSKREAAAAVIEDFDSCPSSEPTKQVGKEL